MLSLIEQKRKFIRLLFLFKGSILNCFLNFLYVFLWFFLLRWRFSLIFFIWTHDRLPYLKSTFMNKLEILSAPLYIVWSLSINVRFLKLPRNAFSHWFMAFPEHELLFNQNNSIAVIAYPTIKNKVGLNFSRL